MTGANRYSFITSTILPARRTVSSYVRASLACVRGRELHQVQEWRRYLLDVVLSELRIAYPDVQFFVPPENGRTFTIKNIVFIGGKQKLDGLTLIGVTFVETKIYYDGVYPVSLDRTSFVNCTFNMPSGPQSIPFLKICCASKEREAAASVPIGLHSPSTH